MNNLKQTIDEKITNALKNIGVSFTQREEQAKGAILYELRNHVTVKTMLIVATASFVVGTLVVLIFKH